MPHTVYTRGFPFILFGLNEGCSRKSTHICVYNFIYDQEIYLHVHGSVPRTHSQITIYNIKKKYVIPVTRSILNQNDDIWRQRDQRWQMHLPAELVLPASIVCCVHRRNVLLYSQPTSLQFYWTEEIYMPNTMAARLKAWDIFACSSTRIVCSNPTRGMDVCLRCPV
jgi:hypothetical protein